MLFRSYGYSKSLQGKLHFPCADFVSYPIADELDLEIFSQPIVYERITKQTQKMQKTA